MSEDKPKVGAPKGNQNASKDDGLTSVIRIRCKPEEKGRYDEAARKEKLPTAKWIRERLNEALKRSE